MKSITIHAMDDSLAKAIEKQARALGVSMNELLKRLLAESLGLKVRAAAPHRKSFAPFSGTWNKEDVREFTAATADTQSVDTEDWA